MRHNISVLIALRASEHDFPLYIFGISSLTQAPHRGCGFLILRLTPVWRAFFRTINSSNIEAPICIAQMLMTMLMLQICSSIQRVHLTFLYARMFWNMYRMIVRLY